jgi:hypothetical protein
MDKYGFVSHEFTLESEDRKTDARRPSALATNIALRLQAPFDVRQAEQRRCGIGAAELVIRKDAGRKCVAEKHQKRCAVCAY